MSSPEYADQLPDEPAIQHDERGASLTEYALLVALIAVACVSALTALSGGQEGSISGSASKLTSAMYGN